MKYEKASADVIKFGKDIVFLAGSLGCIHNYSSAQEALDHECGGFSGNTHSFTCTAFGGYTGRAPMGASVTIAGATYTYVFETNGNSGRWHCSSNN